MAIFKASSSSGLKKGRWTRFTTNTISQSKPISISYNRPGKTQNWWFGGEIIFQRDMFKFHVGCRDVRSVAVMMMTDGAQSAFSSVPLNAWDSSKLRFLSQNPWATCRVTTLTSSTPKRCTTKTKTPRLQPADVRSLSTTHSSPSSPAVTKSDCEVGWNFTQDTSVIRRCPVRISISGGEKKSGPEKSSSPQIL